MNSLSGAVLLVCVLVGCHAGPHARDCPQLTACASQYQQLVDDLAAPAMQGRGIGTQGIELAAAYIASHLQNLPLDGAFQGQWKQNFEVTISDNGEQSQIAAVQNVAGTLAGAGPLADQYIVIGAHYDHLGYGGFGSLSSDPLRAIHPGADDNASGVAAMIMLAERLARLYAEKAPVERRGIIFVGFTAEEHGRLGSIHFLENLCDIGIEPRQITAMINMDMVGRMRNRRVYMLGGESGDRLRYMIDQVRRGSGLDIRTRYRTIAASDHVSFHEKRIPGILIYTGMHSDYHRPSDTPDRINAHGAVLIVNMLERLVMQLALDQQPLRFSGP